MRPVQVTEALQDELRELHVACQAMRSSNQVAPLKKPNAGCCARADCHPPASWTGPPIAAAHLSHITLTGSLKHKISASSHCSLPSLPAAGPGTKAERR